MIPANRNLGIQFIFRIGNQLLRNLQTGRRQEDNELSHPSR